MPVGVDTSGLATDTASEGKPPAPLYRDRADSLRSIATERRAARVKQKHVVISLVDRRLWVIDRGDTLLDSPVAVGTGQTLEFEGHRWSFFTPRGVRTVRAKRESPRWRPPTWAYAEVARENHLRLALLRPGRPVTLRDGSKLVVRDSLVGLLLPDGFAPLPLDEHIVFDSTLFVPPVTTKNRELEGELGPYLLDIGDGYLLHGTPDPKSIGDAATHGCIRLRDEDLALLYALVPVGTRVYLY